MTNMVLETRSDALQNLEGWTACMICQINVTANDPAGDGINGMKDKTLYPLMEEMRRVKSLSTQEWSSILTSQILSKWWNCMMNTASHMMRSTTQAGIQNIYAPGERKLRQHLDHMRYPNLKGKWYSDTFFMKVTLVRWHMCGQILTNGLGFDIPYPLARKGDSSFGLD